MNVEREIREIGNLLMSAALVHEIRKAVASIGKQDFIVTDGTHHARGKGYDVVVAGESSPETFRRIRGSVKNIEVDRIAENVIGVRYSRRTRK